MKNLLAALLAVLTSIVVASAQSAQPVGSALGADGIIQITTTFRARIEGAVDPRDVPTTLAQDSARRTLYNMAANECRLLAEFWKADCRLFSFSVYFALADSEAQPSASSMFGTAVYELRMLSLPAR